MPTRLGEETQIVHLARLGGEQLIPFERGPFPWDLSSIRVAKRKLTTLSPEFDEGNRSQLETLINAEKRLSKYAIILPMEEDGEGYWISQGINSKGEVVDIKYMNSTGLMVGDEIEGG